MPTTIEARPAARPGFRAALLLAALLPLSARAGTVVSGEVKSLDGSASPFTWTLSSEKDRVRIQSSNAQGSLLIYRGDKGLLWIVNEKEKTYSEMTRQDIENMAKKMNDAMKKMQEQMASLPPDQRAMMEKMMGSMPGMGGPKQIRFKKIGAGKVGAWACDKYEVVGDGKKMLEACQAAPKTLGIDEAEVNAMRDLAKPFEQFARNMEGLAPLLMQDAPTGFPVRTVSFQDGKAVSESVVKEAKNSALAASLFEIPKGLTKQAMPAAGG
jgi:hypothetical protein